MSNKYKLVNTEKVTTAFKLDKEDKDLLIKAVELDIQANLNNISKDLKRKDLSKQAQRDKNVKELAEKSRIIK
ncbi:capsid morphogenesis B protein [Staphylococcus warneri]|uniref:capsid morphogenesis B protein n=1 Tax=Staphylococcus warneri TaxID=1292 RepID=UPI00287F6072|nr:capsid morphogenesis B protein [Staphylococcus warneri]WNF18275.1 capsid morphogenesis B protein [Staphylococcus warneri]